MNRFRLLFLFSVIAVATVACRDEEGPFADGALLSDVAVIENFNTAEATFSVRNGEDTNPATLTAAGLRLSEDEFKKGDRALIYYKYIDSQQPAYTSGNIKVSTILPLNNSQIKIVNIADYPQWDSSPIYLNSIWRSGNYINIYSRLTFTTKPRELFLVADKPTSDNEMPDVYLVHSIGHEPDNFMRKNYFSVDISPIWSLPTCKGVKIHICSSNNPQTVFIFNKPDI